MMIKQEWMEWAVRKCSDKPANLRCVQNQQIYVSTFQGFFSQPKSGYFKQAKHWELTNNIFHGHLTSRWLHQRQYNIPNQIQPYWQGAKEGLLTIQLDRLGVLLSRGFPISFKKRPFLLFWIQTSWAKSLQTLPIVRFSTDRSRI